MVNLSSPLKDTAVYESFFIDILGEKISEQHARILVLMFKLGGYTTLKILTDHLAIAQPTVSVRVEELVIEGLIRKNTELMPMVLVLNLSIENLTVELEKRIFSQRNAISFLLKASEIENKSKISGTFFQAIQALFPNQQKLATIITHVYLNEMLTRDELYKKYDPKSKTSEYLYRDFDSFISNHREIFRVLHGKQRKIEMYVQARLPLDLFAKNRLTYVESLNTHYTHLLELLQLFLSEEYDAILPHQLLKYPSDVKKKIDTCLKNYSTIRIIDNSICQEKMGSSISELLIQSAQFGTTDKKGVEKEGHKLFILSQGKPSVIKNIKSKKIQFQPIKDTINSDYTTRDFIIFDHHGCLVVSSIPNTLPYYNIAPQFTKTSLNAFESNWM